MTTASRSPQTSDSAQPAGPSRRRTLPRFLTRVPVAAWVCAAIAAVNGVCWAVTTPPYWVPDEIAGMGYVQYVAENGDVPRRGVSGDYSEEMYTPVFTVEGRPTWLQAEHRRIFEDLEGNLSRTRPGQAAYLANYPPLYYGLAGIPYRIAYEATFLDRVFAARLMSALLAGVTVLFIFMFLRELLPRTPWAWAVGGLAVAFQPMFGFMSGGVNNDNLLYTAAAALFFLMARAFRRGLNTRLGVAIGVAIAVGLLAKQSFLGLVPGAVVGLGLVAWQARGEARRAARKGAFAALAVGLLPWFAWLVVGNLVLDRATSDTGGITSSQVNELANVSGHLSYLWQAFLPRLPFMEDFFGSYYPPFEVYFKGFIGRFGWAEYSFSLTFQRVALAFFALLVVLAGRELWRRRESIRARWREALTYTVMFCGLLLLIEIAAYRYHLSFLGQYFEQGRYLLPLLALYGAFVAVAARGAGERWGPALGAFLVVLAMGHSLFSLLLTITRFYT
jgi:4-amino-4-deoxy-L-arabinose transferase-like glycosyltransferase